MSFFCEIFGCLKNCRKKLKLLEDQMKHLCEKRIKESQADCNSRIEIIREAHKEEIALLKAQNNYLKNSADELKEKLSYWKNKYEECARKSLPSRLLIKDGALYFKNNGTERFIGIGVWRREALCLEAGQEGEHWSRCGKNYSLTWAEREFHKYGLNYLRTDICNDPKLVRSFCERMYEKNVVVELTLKDSVRDLGSIEETVEATKDLKNIIYECWNELYAEDDVDGAISIAKNLRNQGLIVSGGAIGAGGEKYADYAKKKGLYDIVSIIQVHRHWPYQNHEDNDWILGYKHYDKPIGRNEFFDRKELGLSGVKFIFEKSLEHGAQLVNYYGFRVPGFGSDNCEDAEGSPYYKYLEIASEVLSKYNES